jgi:hypothetical protein
MSCLFLRKLLSPWTAMHDGHDLWSFDNEEVGAGVKAMAQYALDPIGDC